MAFTDLLGALTNNLARNILKHSPAGEWGSESEISRGSNPMLEWCNFSSGTAGGVVSSLRVSTVSVDILTTFSDAGGGGGCLLSPSDLFKASKNLPMGFIPC
jgi:hypothetical protein